MTDMHREGFERGIRLEYKNFDSIEAFELDEDGDYYDEALIDMWRGWQAAMRYRDEQARCECAYTCKFCRDEQEKQP